MVHSDLDEEYTNGGDYDEKLAQLLDPQAEKPVYFKPTELLRLIIDNHGTTQAEFSVRVLHDKPRFCLDLFRNPPRKLKPYLGVKLAQLARQPPHNQPAFWLQLQYALSSMEEVPKLDLARAQQLRTSAYHWVSTITSAQHESGDYLSP